MRALLRRLGRLVRRVRPANAAPAPTERPAPHTPPLLGWGVSGPRVPDVPMNDEGDKDHVCRC